MLSKNTAYSAIAIRDRVCGVARGNAASCERLKHPVREGKQ
jgi:hypothetical protein